MTDQVLFYSGELAIQAAGGIILGSVIEMIMPKKVAATTKNNVFKHTVETVVQTSATAAGAVMFIAWMQNRGFDVRTNPIGSAPFWFWLLQSQPTLTSKVKGIVDLAGSFAEELDDDVIAMFEKKTPGGSTEGEKNKEDCGCQHQ
jgi:hypothetical protein